MKNFVHLHVHSDNSLLDGYGRISEYIKKAKDLNMPAIALTDHNNLTGAFEFIYNCKKMNIKPIVGVEFNVFPIKNIQDDFYSTPNNEVNSTVSYDDTQRNLILNKGSLTHLTVLAKNQKGLNALFKLVYLSNTKQFRFSDGNPDNDKPRIPINEIAKYSDDLIVLTGCPHSELNIRIRLNQLNQAKEYLSLMKETFKNNLYIEIMPWKYSVSYNPKELMKLSKEFDIPAVLTNDVHYLDSDNAPYQEMMMAIDKKAKMIETPSYKGGLRPALGGNQRHFASYSEMKQLVPKEEFDFLFENTLKIAEQIEDLNIEYNAHLKPVYVIPDNFNSQLEYFDYLIKKGFKEKRGKASQEIQKESLKRIKMEREVIRGNDFINYFLVVQDFVKWALDKGYLVGPGRGSAGGSEVAYLLGITNTDPIRFNLLFERFISEGRGATYEIVFDDGTKQTANISEKRTTLEKTKYIHELIVGDVIDGKKISKIQIIDAGTFPDVDIDFASRTRGEVIDYVTSKYGKDNVASVNTLTKYTGKNAFKDITSINGVAPSKADEINKYYINEYSMKEHLDPQNQSGQGFREKLTDNTLKSSAENASHFEGRLRGNGVHACAIIISSEPLINTIPLKIRPNDELQITQWTYPICESIGLLKMDFLGLNTLDVIDGCFQEIEKRTGKKYTLDYFVQSNLDDKKVYELYSNAHTTGIFQFSSDGVKEMLSDVKPSEFEDLAAITAIYRPGPMGIGLHKEYATRKRDVSARVPFHKSFYGTRIEEILEPTYGALIYQEQIMIIARDCAGFSPQKVDKLRKAIGKKQVDIMKALEPEFKNGMITNGYEDKAVNELWEGFIKFGSYAFNRSHCVSYALNAYISGFLKSHYPIEFMTSLLKMNMNNPVKVLEYIKEVKRMKIKLKAVSINTSELSLTPSKNESNTIVFGFSGLKSFSENAKNIIITERETNGSYLSLEDFCRRINKHGELKSSTLKILANIGAFDEFGLSRKGVFDNADKIIKIIKKDEENNNNLNSLFSFGLDNSAELIKIPEEDYKFVDRVKAESEITRQFLSIHPLDNIENITKYNLETITNEENVYCATLKYEVKSNRAGHQFGILTLDNGESRNSFIVSDELFKSIQKNELFYNKDKTEKSLSEVLNMLNIKENTEEYNAFMSIPRVNLEMFTAYKVDFKTPIFKNGATGRTKVTKITPIQLSDKGHIVITLKVNKNHLKDKYVKKIKEEKGDTVIRLTFPNNEYVDIEDVRFMPGTTQHNLQEIERRYE